MLILLQARTYLIVERLYALYIRGVRYPRQSHMPYGRVETLTVRSGGHNTQVTYGENEDETNDTYDNGTILT
jgi:hypothetical protein